MSYTTLSTQNSPPSTTNYQFNENQTQKLLFYPGIILCESTKFAGIKVAFEDVDFGAHSDVKSNLITNLGTGVKEFLSLII